MAVIPQRELRNNVSRVLRRAESGERIVITVDGRPVAQLGPLTGTARHATMASLAELGALHPVDEDWTGDQERMRAEDRDAATDVWR